MSITENVGGVWKGVQTMVLYVALLIFAIIAWKLYILFDSKLSFNKEELRKALEEVAELEEKNQMLALSNTLLKKTRRLAVISDITCDNPNDADKCKTTFTFTEVTSQDVPVGQSKTFTIEGKCLYVDTQIIKFEDSFAETGDVFKGSALCLFRRLFGEKQKPAEGFPVDIEGKTPPCYASDSPDAAAFEKQLWESFWKLAQDPDLAKSMGVRAAHGAAPYQILVPGNSYKLELRSTGELTFAIDAAASER